MLPKSSPFSTYIFDFDGTIADTLPFMVTAFNEIAPKYNLPLILSENIDVLRDSSAQELLKKYSVSPLQFLEISGFVRNKLKNNMHSISACKGIPGLLGKLKKNGATIGIVTSNSEHNVALFLEQHQINVIDFIRSENNLFGKAKVLRSVIAKQKCAKGSVVYIGDEVRDIQAAHTLGIASIAVTWGFNSEQKLLTAQPSYIVHKPVDIENL